MNLGKKRRSFEPSLPLILKSSVEIREEHLERVDPAVQKLFPKTWQQPVLRFEKGKKAPLAMRVGVVLSGGQAPGGHNVITGLRDALSPGSNLIGFLGGPSGILEKKYIDLNTVDEFRNSGGFDMIGSGRAKIETQEQLEKALEVALELKLDGLVIIGGDDSNTNAALLAEYFLEHDCKTSVVGVPKTIDGDLKNKYVETSFGFDTASKVYSELIGNICRDALSAKKYYHFIRLMGRSASHMTLECVLQTHANFTIVGEEVAARNLSLKQVVRALVDLIEKRAQAGKNYGVVLVPEGLVEFVPEMKKLINELNTDPKKLTTAAQETLDSLPKEIQEQLLLDRDPHGNVQVAHIETEKLLIAMCKKMYSGKLNALSHYFGYEGRCSYPSNFDANYCYALGCVAEVLIAGGKSGYMCAIRNLHADTELWEPCGLPITSLMHMEMRKGKEKPVIAKALVDLNGLPFQTFVKARNNWGIEDVYRYPGPIQFFGPKEVCDGTTLTLELESQGRKSRQQAHMS